MKRGARPKSADSIEVDGGPVYLDTSALVKLYLEERESDALELLLGGRKDLVVSDIAVTEAASAIGRRIREGALDAETGTDVYRQLLADIEDRYFVRASVGADTHREAERLLLSSRSSLRTLDALHLALAIQLAARSVVTFDKQMAAAAVSLGMKTIVAPSGK